MDHGRTMHTVLLIIVMEQAIITKNPTYMRTYVIHTYIQFHHFS